VIPLSRMSRLLTFCRSGEGDVAVELAFSRDRERRVRVVRGKVGVNIATTCERCLEPMNLILTSDIDLLIQEPGQENLQDQDDVLIADDTTSVAELVENELILAMPMIPMHSLDQCAAAKVAIKSGDQPPIAKKIEEPDGEPSPFAELAELKRKNRE